MFEEYAGALERAETVRSAGRVFRARGALIEAHGPHARVGELCRIETRDGDAMAEAVGFDAGVTQLMAYGGRVEPEARVVGLDAMPSVPCSPDMLGRVLDHAGAPLDGLPPYRAAERRSIHAPAPDPYTRAPIRERLATGIRAVDGLLPLGRGQRTGVFAGSGVGKSTFLGMAARNTEADVSVIALVGERGRELRAFITDSLGDEGLRRSAIFAAAGDRSPLERLNCAYAATAAAEYFRDMGKDVLLLFDSLTRFARAQREVGLARGEAPAHRGYPPSVFDLLPKLLERAGTAAHGSITAFYTVLVEGDDMDEPVADNARAVLDAHIVLSRRLAARGRYPAVDVLQSVSRLADDVSAPAERAAARAVKRLLADYAEAEDILNAGLY
jgi:flagellum-specific ATP synthase